MRQRRVDELVHALRAALSAEACVDAVCFLALMQRFIRSNRLSVPAALGRSRLDELAALDLSRLPVHDSPLDARVELRQLQNVSPTSWGGFETRLTELFWLGTTVEAGVDCPECDWMLIVLEDPDAHAPVFECARCTYAQTVDGRPWNGTRLDRPSTDTLARWGYLRRKRGRR